MYVLVRNGVVEKYQYSIGQLRKDNPQTSFPSNPTEELLQEWGVFPVKKVNSPEYDSITHELKELSPIFLDGEWVQTWAINPIPEDQIAVNEQNQAQAVRSERDQRLAASDWVVARSYEKQVPVPEEWVAYRQSLRDLPQQQGFPYNIDWPSEPT